MFKSKKRKELENKVAVLESTVNYLVSELGEKSAVAVTTADRKLLKLEAEISRLNSKLSEV